MKLKKIASLMLAGIMAVSMLAGCKTGTTTDDEKNPTTPATPSVVTYANDALNAAQKGVITFEGSTDLDTILKDVATNPDNLSSDTIETIFGDLNIRSSVTAAAGTSVKVLQSKVADKLTGERVTGFNANTVPADKASQKINHVFAVSGALEEKEAIRRIIDDYDQYITDAHFPSFVSDTNGRYSCDYDAEISALKVTSPEHSEQSAWVVAIVITQNVTKTVAAQ